MGFGVLQTSVVQRSNLEEPLHIFNQDKGYSAPRVLVSGLPPGISLWDLHPGTSPIVAKRPSWHTSLIKDVTVTIAAAKDRVVGRDR
jgi:hypothetical protein